MILFRYQCVAFLPMVILAKLFSENKGSKTQIFVTTLEIAFPLVTYFVITFLNKYYAGITSTLTQSKANAIFSFNPNWLIDTIHNVFYNSLSFFHMLLKISLTT